MNFELESQLKLELNSSDPTGIHTRLSSYLTSIEQENANNFLNDCLDIFPRILFQGKHQPDDLFLAYGVCLRVYVDVASSKEVTTHISLILKTIAKELHLNKERLGESSSLLSIIDFYLEDQSTQSISDAFEYYLSNTISALYFVYGLVSKLALNWTQELETIEEESKVVCIDILHVLSQLILVKLSIKRERTGSENYWMVGSAVIAFIISTKNTLKLQESKKVIMNIIYSEWCETQEIRDILDMMDHYAQRANENKEGIDILNMSLEAFWLFLKVHPIYLLEESELEESELEEISSMAYKQGSSMLKLLYKINHSEMQKKLVAILEDWCNTKDCIQDLPTPVPIVKAWVECQLIHDDCLKSPILFNLLTPSIQKSKRNTWILLEQEWKAYTECTQSSTSGKMRRKMASTFMQFINTTPESLCQNAQTNIEKEKTIVDSEKPVATIHCLQEAITIMRDIISKSEHSSSENLINHQLFVACCLHDLSETKTTFESGKTLSERILYLIYNLFDLLQLKGFTEDSNVALKLMIKVYGLMNLSSDKQLSLLWKNGRLGHPICISPLSLKSVQNLSNEATKFETYKDHFGEEFLQHFSFLFANSHPSSNPRISCDVTSKDLFWSHSTFHALIPKGKLIEALSSAKEAQRQLYSELKKYTHNGQINNAWEMIISFARDVFSLDSPTSNLDKVHTSPWKVLEGYLESTLQIGCIYEMMGDGVEAVDHLKLGKDIASSLDLPLFVVAFSSLLGKLYCQQQKIDLAESELKIAREVLLKIDDKFGCSKCKLLLDAFVIKHIGDLTKIRPAVCEWIVLPATAKNFYEMALEKVNNSVWKNSISYPEEDASMNFVECSCSRGDEDEEKRTKKARLEKKEGVSDQIGCSSYATCLTKCNLSNLGCWQCLPSKVAESGLLDELINLKWEFIRRKMSLQLLSQSGKSFANSNKTNELHGNLLRRISILVVKNTFCFTFASILLEHFQNLVAKETQDDIFSFERAELLLDVSLYLMKSNDSDKSIFSNQNSIKHEDIVSWLLLAFILSRDVPIVLQEVSKLLAVICLVSSKSEEFPLPLSTSLSKMGWVFYFHQASIGAHLSCQFLSNLYEKYKDPNARGGKFDLLRPPNTKENIQDHVANFILALPSTTIVCVSLLGEDYLILLEKLLSIETVPKAWMLVSRKNITAEPVVMLLPLDTIHIDEAIRMYENITLC